MATPAQHNYFHFTRKEKNGILCLMFLISLFIAVPFIYPLIFKEKPGMPGEYQSEIDSLQLIQARPSDFKTEKRYIQQRVFKNSSASNLSEPLQLFYFDPNIIDISQWGKLGVKAKTAEGIRHYIEKGGSFREPADLNKIWGISDLLKSKLLPFVRIPPRQDKAFAYNHLSYPKLSQKRFEHKTYAPVDINSADTSEFIALPGIGNKLALRISAFRDKLGGFSDINQVGETFGLPESTFQKIRPFLKLSTPLIHKLDINSATIEELKVHPYIRWQLANLIVRYRAQHGKFVSINDLKNIILITPEIFKKIEPYLSAE